jgi:hypothetical protein
LAFFGADVIHCPVKDPTIARAFETLASDFILGLSVANFFLWSIPLFADQAFFALVSVDIAVVDSLADFGAGFLVEFNVVSTIAHVTSLSGFVSHAIFYSAQNFLTATISFHNKIFLAHLAGRRTRQVLVGLLAILCSQCVLAVKYSWPPTYSFLLALSTNCAGSCNFVLPKATLETELCLTEVVQLLKTTTSKNHY